MVTLTEVEDEHFQAGQVGPDVDDDDYTDTGLSTPVQILNRTVESNNKP